MWEGMEVGSPALAAPGSADFRHAGSQLAGPTDGRKRTLSQEEADDFCERYQPLVGKVAGQYRNRGVESDELRSAGLLGLVLASKKFDPDRGVPFGGYAKFWIKGQILELFKPKGDAMGLGRASSLNDPAWFNEDKEGNTKLDLVTDDSPPIATVDVSALSDRERKIFGARIAGKTLDEVGKGLGVSRERVRQIEARSIEKVRTQKGNVARTCIRDLIGRRGYRAPSRSLLPFKAVKYPRRTFGRAEIEAYERGEI